jgi:hypothetical protein
MPLDLICGQTYIEDMDRAIRPAMDSRICQMIDFKGALAIRAELETEVSRLGTQLNSFPKTGPMGMVPDAIKSSPAFRAAKGEFDAAFCRLRAFNSIFVRQFAREIRAMRRTRRAT